MSRHPHKVHNPVRFPSCCKRTSLFPTCCLQNSSQTWSLKRDAIGNICFWMNFGLLSNDCDQMIPPWFEFSYLELRHRLQRSNKRRPEVLVGFNAIPSSVITHPAKRKGIASNFNTFIGVLFGCLIVIIHGTHQKVLK